ncbi:MAG: sigma-70 family RNA polymerase sigma factor [Verrucomicrobiales bacterium]|nr:sigma-70 family RNA polymerase sigma factor [Verrucomicrobiales bacterium]
MSDPSSRSQPAPADPQAPEADAAGEDAANVALMLRVKQGDTRAFEQLVERHQSAVIGTVARMLNSVDDAHDIAQQVFLRIWRSADRYQPTAKFTTWMFTITRNLVFNETRRRSRRREVSLESDSEDDAPRQFQDATVAGPDQQALHAELEAAVDRAIAALPEKQRLAVVLRRYQELPYEQLCEILGMSLPAVKSLLFRARNDLRKALSTYLEDGTLEPES